MKSKILTPRTLFLTIAVLAAAFSRLIPHPFNFTPVAAMALFAGAAFSNKRLAFLVPLAAMLISDLILGFHNTILYVYASFILTTLIGMYFRHNVTPGRVILASLISSLLFFLITNFGYWAANGFFNGMNGLAISYLSAIPFYNNDLFGSFFFNSVAGDLFFNGILFGSFYFAKLRFPALARA